MAAKDRSDASRATKSKRKKGGADRNAHRKRAAFSASADAAFSTLETDLNALVAEHREDLELVHPAHRADAVNLIHYLALRRHDVHNLQRRLTELGLSSLGRSEAHVMASVMSIHAMLGGRPLVLPEGIIDFEAGRSALDTNTDVLFGERPRHRVPRIMVTLDDQAAVDYPFVRGLVKAGMNVARINGAHNEPHEWELMADNVSRSSAELGLRCKIAMDLAGPKIRTGPIEDGPRVLRVRPRRDVRGRSLAPTYFELVGAAVDATPDVKAKPDSVTVPVSPAWLSRRRLGDDIALTDTRGSHRQARIVKMSAAHNRASAEIWDTTYLETGLSLRCGGDTTTVGPLPAVAQFHLLCPDDRLWIVRSERACSPWHHGDAGVAEISCTHGVVFDVVRTGERILLDDGKFAGVIESVEPDRFLVTIVDAPINGAKLRAEKGINLPDADLRQSMLSGSDIPLLELAAKRADMLSISFLRSAEDVDVVRKELTRLGAADLPLVLKIETHAAFANLPEILLHAMRSPSVGIMIARGDLAVEVGYARLAEIQEEILWLAEAAHLPLIWATEVLDQLATTGRPSRAELTDAAMSQRAECVMLNKGPYITSAISQLDDILRRMARHQRKTVPLLNPLHTWADF